MFKPQYAENNGNYKHGLSSSKEYFIWHDMKRRCYQPKNKSYKYYGGEGVSVHKDWIDDFKAFYDYVGPMPTLKHTIDRISTKKGYEPGNVRWATRQEQSINRRDVFSNTTSKRRGVTVDSHGRGWRARITVSGKEILLGVFEKEEDAVKKRIEGEKFYWGKV